MTDLQRKEFELLSLFLSVCEKEGIPCFLVCGSALGAVKYSGFIPWDDDVDVALLRPDYDRFLAVAGKYLPPHVFLQTYETDPQYPHLYAKLRDSSTTFIEPAVAHLDINHGIYIDIFPLDGAPYDPRAVAGLERRKNYLLYRIGTVFAVERHGLSKLLWLFLVAIGSRRQTHKLLVKLDRLLRRYPPDASSVLVNHGNWQRRLEYAPRAQYGDGTTATFEGLTVRVPAQYDAYFTQKYGDWRAEPPPDKQVSHHAPAVTDTQHPYTDYRPSATGTKGGRA